MMKLGGRRGDGGWDEGGGNAERQEVAAWLSGRGGGDEATSGISAGTTWLAWDLGGWECVRWDTTEKQTDFERDMGVSLKMS